MSRGRSRRLLQRSACGAVLATIAGLAAGPAASAGPGDFSSSFEAGDPQPTWTDTVEIGADGDKRAAGVRGPKPTGIPGNVTDRVVEVRASGEHAEAGEVKENLVDGSPQTKWLVFESTGWVEFELFEPIAVVHYALTSANDAPGRDPKDWTLSGSNDGESWTVLDEQTGQDFPERFHTNEYRFDNGTAYLHYRLDFTANHGDDILQLAEVQLSDGSEPSEPPEDMISRVGRGPSGFYNAKSAAGFTGLRAFRYAGMHTADGRGYSYNRVFDVDVPVSADSELSYMIAPDFIEDDLSYPSTYAAVDLAFTDGTYLSELGATDQHGATLSPQGQGRSKTLYANQWNHKRSRIGEVAAGKTVDRIVVAYDNPDGPADFGGWVDDIRIDGDPPAQDRSRPTDWVLTTRGTNSSFSFSRGNTIPATAVPHGFNFWVPATNARTLSWLYEYHRDNNEQNLPELEALSLSHEPSPWMGDRQTFQVMPSAVAGEPPTGRGERALAFRHENEVAKPHRYGVQFENGIEADIAPTDHAAMLRFTFPDEHGHLIFDNVDGRASVTIDEAAGVVTGWSDVRSGLSNGATRMYLYATLDEPITAAGSEARQTAWATFDARTVTMRIATSLISIDQAKRNLELEIAPGDTFEAVRERARELWDDKLDVIEVEGATEDQLTTLYSSLYRLFLYPNSAHENVGTRADPVYKHAVQSSTSTPASGPTETGAPVVDGKVYVNNGFWDTYRTAWSAYSLLASSTAGELVDGFVQQYRDGGWVSRWSSPGYANLMTGTSSDVSFADAFVKGVRGIDAEDTYDAALKNATVAPPGGDPYNTSVGRKGLIESIFLGYTPSSVSEGVSWALEGYINDFGIANMAAAMAEDPDASPAEQRRLQEEHQYFLGRARNYVQMFDPAIGFFQGRASDGRWKSSPDEYDPRVWGHDHDYTETNGWNFAFHVPHDGRGLANLYGGRDGLAAKLDTFFSIPETAEFPGSYGGIIHEMVEARDVRMGQWGFSNQVSHHIPWMYDYTGQPWKTQEKVREVLGRHYIGSEIGQGYAGDEDNGETSAWYLFGALGFYPLQVGSERYAIGSPLFEKATVHLDNGRQIVVEAPGNSRENVYVQGLTVDGRAHDKTYLTHEQLADGAVLEFDMGPKPSDWAAGADGVLPSITDDDDVPRPLQDATGTGRGTGSAEELFDDSSGTRVSLAGGDRWVEYRFRDDSKQLVHFYTLTSAEGDAAADPGAWVLKGSNDGRSWTVLDERQGETFEWRSQTRPFKLARPANFSRYRIEFTDGRDTTRLAEVELLTSNRVLATPLSADVKGAIAWPGEAVPVEVTVTNSGEPPASGEVAATVPDGWSVEPASAAFGPIAGGESETVTFAVTVPDDAEPGAHPVQASVTSRRGSATASGDVHVVGDTIEFTPGTAAEEPWLFDADGSQLDGTVYDGRARFTDGQRYAIYLFELPDDVTGGRLTLDIGNQFLVKVSEDGEGWRTVLEETREIRDLSNRAERSLDLAELRPGGGPLYLWIGDSHTGDGWGAWLARLWLELERGG
ncbi:MAG: GH92 family glycosyl hydrolase [Solirubrobacteraceae bacterium]